MTNIKIVSLCSYMFRRSLSLFSISFSGCTLGSTSQGCMK